VNVSLGRKYKFEMGGYESYEPTTMVNITHHDMGITDSMLTEMSVEERADLFIRMKKVAEEYVDILITPDIRYAKELTNAKSTMLDRIALPEAEPEVAPTPPPRKRTARRPNAQNG
jgi:hypothetical protein